jgi:carboxylesterase type B
MASMIAWSAEPIIAVSMNYRLGALGFLPSAVTTRMGALNLGLQDQVESLKWIKAHIGGFGGDSKKITIMGDSAGGHAVRYSRTPLNGPCDI